MKNRKIKKVLYCLFLFLFVAVFYTPISAQVTVLAKDTKIKQVILQIEKSSGYKFFYSDDYLDLEKKISVNIKNEHVESALNKVFKGTDIRYTIGENKQIMLTAGKNNENEKSAVIPQNQKKYSGIVKDESGEPIIGANVTDKGTQNRTITDVDGKFSIETSAGSTLSISYIGYASQEVKLDGNTILQIVMRENQTLLDEIVVVGYGTQKKRDLTGAVTSIKVAEMPVQTYSTISHALAGKAAGLQVTQTSAQVGGGAIFRIRGETSTGAGNEPLVIIDGFPVSRTANEGSGNRYNSGSLDNILESINPNDIESIEVLKDASATSIYGSRAGHGVIIVTTKRGKNQKLNVTYSGIASVQHMKNGFKMLNAKEYMTQRNRDNYEIYLKNNGLDVYKDYVPLNPNHVTPAFVPKYSDEEIASIRGTDWLGEITRTGFQQSHNISLSGGDELTQYMASVNYFDQTGVIKNNDMNRTTVKFNFDRRISMYVKTGLTFNLNRNSYDNIPLGSGENQNMGLVASAMRFNPIIQVYNEDGSYALNPEVSFVANPVSLLEITDKTSKDRALGSAYVEVEPVKGLLLRASLGLDRRDSKRKTYLPKTTMFGAAVGGQANIAERGDIDYLMDLTATYTKEISRHNFTVLAGYSYQEFNGESFRAGNQDFLIDNFLYNNLSVGAYAKPTVASWASKSALGSYFARLNYSYLSKYLLTATVRADGASNFNPEYRWGYFPSVSIGWRFSEESFMSSLSPVLSNGKLRIGYGQTGNSNVGNRILDSYGPVSGNVFNESYYIGIRPTQLGNPKLTWETTSELNIGLDLGFLGNRINAMLEYYDRTISDLLVTSKSLMSYNEITSIAANIGKTHGNGLELTLNTVNVTNKDLQWTTDLTYSLYRDRWKERDPNWKPAVYQSATDPIYAWFSYLSDGLLQAGEKAPEYQKSLLPGQIKLKDISGEDGKPDGKLDNYDMVYMGTGSPDFYFGINNTLKYKGFDLNVYFYGEVNRLRNNSYYEYFGILGSPGVTVQGFNASKMALETWHHDSQNTKYPNPIMSDFGSGNYYVKNISFIRCRNITLGYTLPISKKIANKVRIYADVNNPFVLTNWSGVDPETDEHQYAYPNISSVSFGLDISF